MKILVLSAVRLVVINIQGFPWHNKKRINLLVLQVNDLDLLEVNAEIAILSISWLRGHFFMKTLLPILINFGVSDENGTYNDRESYVLDPKLTLTCIAHLRKVPILYRIGKKYSVSSASGEKIPSALRVLINIQITLLCLLERTRPFDQNLSKIHKIVY